MVSAYETNMLTPLLLLHIQSSLHVLLGLLVLALPGPYGRLALDVHRYHTLVLVSGGVGVTPMFSLLQYLLTAGKDRTLFPHLRKVHFVWVNRDRVPFDTWNPELLKRAHAQADLVKLHLFATGEKAEKAPPKDAAAAAAAAAAAPHAPHGPHAAASTEIVSAPSAAPPARPPRPVPPPRPVVEVADVRVDVELTHNPAHASASVTPATSPQPTATRGSSAPACVSPSVHGFPILPGRPPFGRLFSGWLSAVGTDCPSASVEASWSADSRGAHIAVLACGPAPMVAQVQEEAQKERVHFHKETFAF